jgi:hypothetical protein
MELLSSDIAYLTDLVGRERQRSQRRVTSECDRPRKEPKHSEQLAAESKKSIVATELLKQVATSKSVDDHQCVIDVIVAVIHETTREVFTTKLQNKVGNEVWASLSATNASMVTNLLHFRDEILQWLPNCHGKYLKSNKSLFSEHCLQYIATWVKNETDPFVKDTGVSYDEACSDIWRVTFDKKKRNGEFESGKFLNTI